MLYDIANDCKLQLLLFDTLWQARHFKWAFSTLLKAGPESWGFKIQDVRAAADSLYAFMHDNMMKEVDGGEACHCHHVYPPQSLRLTV